VRARAWLEVAAGVVVAVLLVVAWHRSQEARTEALRADRAEARADTTRLLAVGAVLDQQVWERRALQQEQRADSVDRELRLTRKAYVALRVSIASLDTTVHGQTAALVSDTAVRTAHFDIRQVPFTAAADVRLPPPPAAGDLELRVSLDSLLLDLRLGCGQAGVGGVRPASAVVSGPPWARVALGRVEQAVEVCSPAPPFLPSLGGFWRGAKAGAGLGAGATILMVMLLRAL